MRAVTAVMAGFMAVAMGWASGAVAQDRAGPLVPGVSFDQARAALPDAAWSEVLPQYASEPNLTAPGAIALGGLMFDVTVPPASPEGSSVVLEHFARRETFQQCSASVIAVAAAADGLYGAFEPVGDTSSSGTATRFHRLVPSVISGKMPGGVGLMAGIAPVRLIAVGSSRLGFAARSTNPGRGNWTAVRPRSRDGVTVVFGASYTFAENEPPECHLFLALTRHPPIPRGRAEPNAFAVELLGSTRSDPPFDWTAYEAPRALDIASLTPTYAPSIGDLHYTLDNLGRGLALPPEGVDVELVCRLDRSEGVLDPCWTAVDGVDPDLTSAAIRRSKLHQYAPASIDPGGSGPLEVRLPIRLAPEDRRTDAPPPESEILAMDEMRWRAVPRPEVSSRWFSQVTTTTTFTALCQVQSDLSTVCRDVQADPPSGSGRGTLLRASRSYVPAATLADGSPTAGRWFRFRLTVRVTPPPAEDAGSRRP